MLSEYNIVQHTIYRLCAPCGGDMAHFLHCIFPSLDRDDLRKGSEAGKTVQRNLVKLDVAQCRKYIQVDFLDAPSADLVGNFPSVVKHVLKSLN